ncbi:hypothetical protein A2791_04200 [Candidatus Saccharibacteria bacterium RIFCSPHIGHO2_01_FULL_46_30]|nr:MAG: hypothetical protein A2791_04200 [Candidatus Saccharibacteria bacterium RIFCSPHIGHO2_01_FULL_46_30]
MFNFETFAQSAGQLLDIAGVVVIVAGIIVSTILLLITAFKQHSLRDVYRAYRQNLSRSILIGLEFLVAGDIIRSVAGDLNLDSVLVLAIIVAIRLVLGANLEMEIEGHWPWQRSSKKE